MTLIMSSAASPSSPSKSRRSRTPKSSPKSASTSPKSASASKREKTDASKRNAAYPSQSGKRTRYVMRKCTMLPVAWESWSSRCTASTREGGAVNKCVLTE